MINAATKALLNAIGSKEAPKGYNQIYTPAEKIVGFPKLTEMTLEQIRALQGRMLKGKSASTAVGRYQFLRKTLDATRKEMGISGTAVWTRDLQDRMAVHLMEARGLSKYLKGKMSRETFANNLAKEWASLPVVTRIKGQKRTVNPGESFYAGDGLNASLHDPAKILRLVDALKSPPVGFLSADPPEPAPARETPVAAPNAGPDPFPTEPAITPESSPVRVESLQRALKSKNYYDGAIDGSWTDDSLTGDAVVLLQTRNGLPVDKDAIRLSDVLSAKPYVVASREDATIKTMTERGDPVTTLTGRVKAGIKWVLGLFGLGGAAAGVEHTGDGGASSVLETAEKTLTLWERVQLVAAPFADLFWTVLPWILIPVAIGLPLAWGVSKYVEHKRLAAFKTGLV